MTETIEIEVGPLYAEIHEQYKEGMGEQYTESARQSFEDFVHQFNQQVERQQEAASQQIDVSEVEE